MKVIITGATGFIGGAIVRECFENPKITQILVLSRKPLGEGMPKGDKLTTIIHEDFSTYPPELLEKLAGAEACLWAIGGRAYQFPNVETARKVHVGYVVPAATAFMTALAPKLPAGQKFRFVFCSGAFAEQKQDKSLLFMGDTRRVKGETEKALSDLADSNPDKLEAWSVRPSGVIARDANPLLKIGGKLFAAITADQLARAMVKIALEGHKGGIIENSELLKM